MKDWMVGRLIPVIPATPPIGPPTKYDPARDVFKQLGPAPRRNELPDALTWAEYESAQKFPCGWDERDALV